MKRLQRVGVFALLAAMAVTGVVPMINAAAPGGGAAAKRAAGTRDIAAIFKDLEKADAKATEVMPSLMLMAKEDFRAGDGQKVLPQFKEIAALMKELEGAVDVDEEKDNIRGKRYRFLGLAAALGDKTEREKLEITAKGEGKEAFSAQCALLQADWLTQSKDAAAQEKLLETFAPIAKAHGSDAEAAATLGFLANLGPASNDVTKKVIEVMRANLKGPVVEQSLAQLESSQAQNELVGKPLAVTGRTSKGESFDVKSLKGKVVLIDFWATWCGPCKAELPHVKEVYKSYHDKGFEIVGVSCDSGDEVLNSFVAENGMPWVQLRESSQNEESNWHPLAKAYKVDGIPAMFLLDKQGVLRHVDAREDLEGKVKALLADEGGATTKPAPK